MADRIAISSQSSGGNSTPKGVSGNPGKPPKIAPVVIGVDPGFLEGGGATISGVENTKHGGTRGSGGMPPKKYTAM